MEIEGVHDSNNCKDSCQDVIALKIFDQCKIKEFDTLGPVVSKEDCECIILSPFDDSANLGRIILPGQPIMAPKYTARAKIIKNSFRLTHIDFININCSVLKKHYWSVDIVYHFEFTLQLLGINMKPLKVVCCPTTFHEMKNAPREKECIKAGICYTSQALLYGGNMPNSQVFSDISVGKQAWNYNNPHFLIEINAYPLDVSLKDPCCLECKPICNDVCCDSPCNDACCDSPCSHACCDCPCNDAYCEPFYYIYVSIGLDGVIKLVRLISGVIHAKACAEPKVCENCINDPCKCFSEMEFPKDFF